MKITSYRVAFFLIVLFCPCLFNPLFGQKPAAGGEPSWITRAPTDYATIKVPGDVEDGYMYLAMERQVNLATRTLYHKYVIKIVTEAGIQNSSEVSVRYDPSYEHLIFHNIQIVRNGVTMNKLDLKKVKIVRQETELSRSIYNGSVTAVLFLEDVRKGDRIEYSYSVQGFNPVFRDKYSTFMQVQYGTPIGHLLYRIVCPAERRLYVKNKFTDKQPVIMDAGKDKIYEWDFNNVAALHAQDALPSWYDPYPSVMVSEYASWNEVCKWALPLFTPRADLSGNLKKKITDIQAAAGTDEEKKVLLTLRFVQDEVRYMGIEMGVNSHKPNDPDKIFTQRFGDCKDKSFLLCTMLRKMGIEASPVMINTTDKREIMGWLPTPLAFDHCTARVRLGSQFYWFDPTISFQRGGIKDISYPDYQCGLVITDTTSGLATIALQDPGQVIAHESFTVKDTHGPASLEVITRYTGSFADDLRSEVNSNTKTDLQQTYLDFYNSYYEGTKASDSLKIDDDEKDGTLTTYEYYTINKLWQMEKGVNKAAFDGLLISSLIKKPKEHDRTMPIAFTYPAHYTEEIQIHVPEDWSFEDAPSEIRCPAFLFNETINTTGRSVNIKFEYQALKDHVSASEANTFLSDYDKFKEDLGYSLTVGSPLSTSPSSSDHATQPTNPGEEGNILKALLCLALVAGITFIARRK